MGTEFFDRSITEGDNERGVHHMVDEVLEETATYCIHRFTMQGDYDDLKAKRDEHYCNELIKDDEWLADTMGRVSDKVIVNMVLNRSNGMRGTLAVTVKAYFRGFEGGIDFETVSKDIHYWRQLCSKDVPYLNNIMLWEQMKQDQATTDLFYSFKFLDKDGQEHSVDEIPDGAGSVYSGEATKALAEMIMRGVESFNEYVPTLTMTYHLAKHPSELGITDFNAGSQLGKVMMNTDLGLSGGDGGYDLVLGGISANPSARADFEALYSDGESVIICTGDQIRGNSDGSYTLTRCYTKYRAVEKELYIGALGQKFGPYDVNS